MIAKRRSTHRPRVYLSYAAADEAKARRLETILSHSDAHVFTIDGLSAGQDWRSIIKREIAACDLLVVLLSSNALKSNFVLLQIGAAWALRKTTIAVMADPSMASELPVRMDPLNVIDLSDPEMPTTLLRMVERYGKAGAATKARSSHRRLKGKVVQPKEHV